MFHFKFVDTSLNSSSFLTLMKVMQPKVWCFLITLITFWSKTFTSIFIFILKCSVSVFEYSFVKNYRASDLSPRNGSTCKESTERNWKNDERLTISKKRQSRHYLPSRAPAKPVPRIKHRETNQTVVHRWYNSHRHMSLTYCLRWNSIAIGDSQPNAGNSGLCQFKSWSNLYHCQALKQLLESGKYITLSFFLANFEFR